MSAIQKLLTDHLGIWTVAEVEKKSGRGRAAGNAASVYGIKKLRELILDLAVRGKLVPQDSNDEPASALLKRIQIEKTHLVAKGEIKKDKSLPVQARDEIDFEIPNSWAWTRMSSCSKQVTDGEHLTPERTTDASQIALVTAKNVRDGSMDYADTDFVDREVAKKCWNRCKPELNDILIVSVGATIGRLTVVDDHRDMVIVRSVTLVKPLLVNVQYLAIALRSPFLQRTMWAGVKQNAQPCLYLSVSSNLPIPIPPLAEQSRIVAKVDELMELCDQLEAKHSNAADAHEQLVGQLLGTLTQSQSAAEFAANWQRVAMNFDTLFTTDASIEALKQILLQLAVMGKLVAQDPQDEPASELIKRIQAEKVKLVAERKIKKEKPTDKVREKEPRFGIPSTWEWVHMADLCRPISSGSTPTADLFAYEEGIPFLKVYNIRDQEIDFDYKRQFVGESLNDTKLSRSILYPGDVVMNIVGPPLGKVAIIPDTYPRWNCNQALVFFGLIAPMSNEYILTYLKEGSFLKDIELIGTAGQDNISVTKSKNILTPVPPIEEQHRIVAKVKELMTLCDQLKSRINDARQCQQVLADVFVSNAVS